METSRLTLALKIQISAVCRKCVVDVLMGQRFHYNDGVKTAVLNLFHDQQVAAVAEWYRYRTVACFVTGSNPVPLKTRRVGQRCTLNLSRAETSSRWCGVVVRRGGCQLRCRPRHLTMVQSYVVRRQKPSCS
ncbi:uncharacterized protein TNCV_27581 [Trichonephila clavipes]|uniref:Uncharacterized protein n=1 Tax=Trichonephila clavipes TaxID=2585209 RepID=A0A8X6WK08_TRICX|nr:uncharacterized protein TNCV_27581 [Trichonephila clavipes]